MDPDAALQMFRNEMASAADANEEASLCMDEDKADRWRQHAREHYANAADHAENLDEWISLGGFLPTAWTKETTP